MRVEGRSSNVCPIEDVGLVRSESNDRRPVSLFVGLFVLGVVAGLVEFVTDSDNTSTGASVAAANWVHIGAAALIVGLIVARRRNQRSLVGFLVRPFTYEC